MLTLTKQTDYALLALAGLVEQRATEHEPQSASKLAREYTLPPQLLVKVLKKLQRAGLVGSTRGAHGGYYLTQSPAWITLLDIIEALEGPIRLTNCCNEEGDNHEDEACPSCAVMNKCLITARIQQVNERVTALFRQITLKDLLTQMGQTPVPVNIHDSVPTRRARPAGTAVS